SDEEIAIRLLQRRGVLVHPGHFYDFPRAGHLVISLITPPAEFAAAAEIMLEDIGVLWHYNLPPGGQERPAQEAQADFSSAKKTLGFTPAVKSVSPKIVRIYQDVPAA